MVEFLWRAIGTAHPESSNNLSHLGIRFYRRILDIRPSEVSIGPKRTYTEDLGFPTPTPTADNFRFYPLQTLNDCAEDIDCMDCVDFGPS